MSFKIENWIPGQEAWQAFCTANTSLGLTGSPDSWNWFNREHRQTLIERGVAVVGPQRRLLVDADAFAQHVFALLVKQHLRIDRILCGQEVQA